MLEAETENKLKNFVKKIHAFQITVRHMLPNYFFKLLYFKSAFKTKVEQSTFLRLYCDVCSDYRNKSIVNLLPLDLNIILQNNGYNR